MKTIDVVAAIIERDGKILLAQRPAHADQPGLWEFAGGKVA
ncbi:NUDIX domain-containing protein, partial [Enterobacter sp.]